MEVKFSYNVTFSHYNKHLMYTFKNKFEGKNDKQSTFFAKRKVCPW